MVPCLESKVWAVASGDWEMSDVEKNQDNIVVKGGFEILSNAKEAKQSDSSESPATEK